MHLYCPECGKHIDVSTDEIERLNGHYVCPQCLAAIEIDLGDVAGTTIETPAPSEPLQAPHAVEAPPMPAPQQQPQPTAVAPQLPPEPAPAPAPATAPQAPSPPPYRPAHAEPVLRYCKRCGAFLRQGVNYCPKCGNYVRVTPAHPATAAAPPRRTATYNNPSQQPPSGTMANKKRKKPSKTGGDKSSPSGIYSLGGCLTLTIIVVAIFFILYIVWGIHLEG